MDLTMHNRAMVSPKNAQESEQILSTAHHQDVRNRMVLFLSLVALMSSNLVACTGSKASSSAPQSPSPSGAPTETPTLIPSPSPSPSASPATATTLPIQSGGVQASVVPSETSTNAPIAGPSATPIASRAGTRQVTLADNGSTIQMTVGDSFLLFLGEGFEWTVDVQKQGVVSRVVNIAVIRG